MIDLQVTIKGESNIDIQSPLLFCANHFTRFETFIMPNIFYKKLNIKARSLGDKSIFTGKMGDFLSKMGSISTNDPNRDKTIICDLMRAENNWIIYPEGSMIKNKKVYKKNEKFYLNTKEGLYPVKTGAVVLALKSELEKNIFNQALNRGDIKMVKEIRDRYNLHNQNRLAYRSTKIIPVTITYSPIRVGKNPLMKFLAPFLFQESPMIKEELEIETNLIINSHMHIQIGKPIDIAHYIQMAKKELVSHKQIPTDNTIIEFCRHKLTTIMMDRIYSHIEINFEHIFATILAFYPLDKQLGINEFKVLLFIIAKRLKKLKIMEINKNLGNNFYNILIDEPFEPFDKAMQIALDQGIIKKVTNEIIIINKDLFFNEYDFINIRIKNTFLVIYNEVAILDQFVNCVKNVLQQPYDHLEYKACIHIYHYDQTIFSQDYKKFYSVFYSKPKDIGQPLLLYNCNYSVGLVLSHGYKSAPKEVEDLANFIYSLKINVYCVRLLGHATMPEDLRDCSWQDWYDSYNRGFAALSQISKKIYLAGFSTGGLLALIAASKKYRKIDAIICINTALRLKDIKFNYVLPSVQVLNNFLSLFNADIDFIDTEVENPEINYSKHYVTSIGELKKLIEHTNSILKKITSPILIIQGDNDPVVDPKSAKMIYEGVSSTNKKEVIIKSNYHTIVTKPEKKSVFKAIKDFLI